MEFQHTRGSLTFCLAGLGDRVHLITFVALTLKIPLVVDADLATSVRVFTLINVCGKDESREVINQLRQKETEADSD